MNNIGTMLGKPTFLLIFVLVNFGCSQTSNKVPESKLTAKENMKTITSATWYDPLVLKYINQTDNELIRIAVKDSLSEEWLLDRIENSDSARYFIFQIGHDVSDGGNTNLRFVTDEWLYIDSLTKRIYKYDFANDSLIEWRK